MEHFKFIIFTKKNKGSHECLPNPCLTLYFGDGKIMAAKKEDS
jgi:hypothetical protein